MRSLKYLSAIAALAFAVASCGKKQEGAKGSASQQTARGSKPAKVDCKAWCAKAKSCKNEILAIMLNELPEQAKASAKAEMEKELADEAKCVKECTEEQRNKRNTELHQAMLACYRDDCKAMAECLGNELKKAKTEVQKQAQKAAQQAAQAAQKAAQAAQAGAQAAKAAGAEAAKAGAQAAKAGEQAAKAAGQAAKAAGQAAKAGAQAAGKGTEKPRQ